MAHYPVGTKIVIRNFSQESNGLIGVITRRDGEYYTVYCEDLNCVFELYHSEMEKL